MEKYKKLREKFPQFVYKKYSVFQRKKDLVLAYFFEIPPKFEFKTEIFVKKIPKIDLKDETFLNLVFHLGLVEMLNYWKLTCSQKIKIEAGKLTQDGVNFLKKLILNGMGQYFYENKINFKEKNFLKIEAKKEVPRPKKLSKEFFKGKNKILIPLGGGKDSVVVIEIIKKKKVPFGIFILNPKKPQLDIEKIAKPKETIFVERKLSPLLFKLNKAGFLNGHVPFSAFLSFLATILAYLFKYKKVAFAWEKSASQGNLKYLGKWINHQWSKSLEFENLFKNYLEKNILKGIEIFSPIRKMSDLEIAKYFAKYKKYHPYFTSCNFFFKLGKKRWCNECPKCVFTFLILYPFLKEKEILKIFGENIFENEKLLPVFERLVGLKEFKPFECVGTKNEVKKAIELSIEKIKKERGEIPPLFEKISKKLWRLKG
jgi:tRNA(Ile)-lysidine synthase TilS/MesJ